MTQEEKARAYNKALEKAKEIKSKILSSHLSTESCKAVSEYIDEIIPELRKEEKSLTSFQQCLNCVLRGVYYAEVPDEKVNEFILNVVRTRTDELIKLAKKHEYTDCQLRESEDERIRKGLIEALKTSKTVGELKFILPEPTREEAIVYLEKQKEQEHPEGCFTCDEYKKGYEAGRLNGFTAGYNKAMKEQKPAEWNANDKAFIKDCANILVANDYAASAERLLSMFPIKPVEWSDTNELVFKDICKHLKEEGYNGWIVLLNALRNGEFQLKQEWSEEDSNMLHDIEGYVTGTGSSSGITKEERSKWLWSLPKRFNLQPKQEWSEENEKIQQDIQYALRYAYFNNVIDKQKLEYTMSWLNSLRPSWKPSEEQMKALKNSAFGTYQNGDGPALRKLYEQLKKL